MVRMELEQLETRVRTERDRFHEELARLNQPGNEQSVETQLPVVELAPLAFTVNDRFALRKELAWLGLKHDLITESPSFGSYTLSVELAVPIDYVLLQSDVKVDLLDVERNSAVISLTEPEPGVGNNQKGKNGCFPVRQCIVGRLPLPSGHHPNGNAHPLHRGPIRHAATVHCATAGSTHLQGWQMKTTTKKVEKYVNFLTRKSFPLPKCGQPKKFYCVVFVNPSVSSSLPQSKSQGTARGALAHGMVEAAHVAATEVAAPFPLQKLKE